MPLAGNWRADWPASEQWWWWQHWRMRQDAAIQPTSGTQVAAPAHTSVHNNCLIFKAFSQVKMQNNLLLSSKI